MLPVPYPRANPALASIRSANVTCPPTPPYSRQRILHGLMTCNGQFTVNIRLIYMQDYPTKSNLLSPDVYSGVKMVKIALTAWVSLGGTYSAPHFIRSWTKGTGREGRRGGETIGEVRQGRRKTKGKGRNEKRKWGGVWYQLQFLHQSARLVHAPTQ